MGDIRAGKGTLGKLATDDVLYNKLRDTSSNLSEATSKLNKNDNTAGNSSPTPSSTTTSPPPPPNYAPS